MLHIARRFNRLFLGRDLGHELPGPLDADVREQFEALLSYQERVRLRGAAEYAAKRNGAPITFEIEQCCFDYDVKDRMVTSFGFLERIFYFCRAQGVKHRYSIHRQHPRPEVFEPHWDRVYRPGRQFKHRQEEMLCKLLSNENGRFWLPPGYGKSWAIAVLADVLVHARIAVVTKNNVVLTERLYPELCQYLPDVGLVHSRRKRYARVTCYSAGSLHYCPEDIDILLFDEGHQACADTIAHALGRFTWARMFSFSASWEMRLDHKDMRGEAIFGPLRMEVTYDECQRAGVIVPMEALMRPVELPNNPCAGYKQQVAKKRHGIWRNTHRNRLVCIDSLEAALERPDEPVLVLCETIEHVLALHKLLPWSAIIYHENGMDPKDFDYFEAQGLIGERFQPMTEELKRRRIQALMSGRPGIYIGNTVLNIGVDCKYVSTVVRADAGGSPTNDVQLPGRASRKNDRGKLVGQVRDYSDRFDSRGFGLLSSRRRGNYESFKWQVRSSPTLSVADAKRELKRLLQQYQQVLLRRRQAKGGAR